MSEKGLGVYLRFLLMVLFIAICGFVFLSSSRSRDLAILKEIAELEFNYRVRMAELENENCAED